MVEEKGNSDSDIIERAKKNLKRAVKRMSKSHDIGRMCMAMVAGGEEQWADDLYKKRRDAGINTVTINRLSTNVNNVANKHALERSRIKAMPFEDADVATAKVANGLAMHIQYSDKSDAAVAYNNAFFDLIVCGFGYYRIDTEYCDDLSFDQEIVIKEIDDPFSVFTDMKKKNYAFVINYMTKEEFEEEYGDKAEGGSWDVDNMAHDPDESVMVVEYWERTSKDQTIYKIRPYQEPVSLQTLGAPQVGNIDMAINQTFAPTNKGNEEYITVTKEELDQYPGADIIDERKTKVYEVKSYIISGDEIIETSEYDGDRIPIVGAFAREYRTRNDDRFFKPLVYDSIDPQKLYNYSRSQDAEWLQLAIKAQWVGFKGQFKGVEDEWSASNTDRVPYLEVEPVVVAGQVLPLPQRQFPPQPSQAHTQNAMLSVDEIKATMGIFDPSLGNVSGDRSGIAIQSLQQQGDVATNHFFQAFNIALREGGLVILDLIPKMYDTARTVRILGDDMIDELVSINQWTTDSDGKRVLYDLKSAKYDLKIESGPLTDTRRQETFKSLIEMAKVIPAIGNVAPDILAQSADFDKADTLSFRLQAAIDPQIITRAKMLEQGGRGGPSQEQMMIQRQQQQLQALQGQLAQMINALKQASGENQALKKKIDQARIAIAQINAKAGIDKEKIRSQTDIQTTEMEGDNRLAVEGVKQMGNKMRGGPVINSQF